MTAILSIIALVTVISLLDYFGSRSWQQVTSTVRNDTVFEKRNKQYGAFTLRRDYDRNLLLIMVSFVFGTGVLYAAFVGLKPSNVKSEFLAPIVEPEPGLDIPLKEIPPVEIPKKVEVPASSEKTIVFVEPVVSDKTILDKVKTQEELDKEKAASEKAKLVGTGIGLPPISPVKKDSIIEKPKGPVDPDVEASYPGGYPKMTGFIQENFRVPDIESSIKGKCYLKFIVNEDGKISSIKIERGIPGCPECDKEAIRILKSMPRWTPGSIKGVPVSSYFILPIAFEIE